MTKFNTNWKSSSKPKKQVKYRFNAPLHLRGKMLRTHLSDDLNKKYDKRTVRVVKGDKVKVMAGQFKGKSGKISEIDVKKYKVVIDGITHQKADGTKLKVLIAVSNVMITEFNLEDKKRQELLKRK
jgi:large subunit ribosomal protein L24